MPSLFSRNSSLPWQPLQWGSILSDLNHPLNLNLFLSPPPASLHSFLFSHWVDPERDQLYQDSPRFKTQRKCPVFTAGQCHRLHPSQFLVWNGSEKGKFVGIAILWIRNCLVKCMYNQHILFSSLTLWSQLFWYGSNQTNASGLYVFYCDG